MDPFSQALDMQSGKEHPLPHGVGDLEGNITSRKFDSVHVKWAEILLHM